jgi:hypothetical protein
MVVPTPTVRMPGGGISRRPLHFIILADCSGGMKGEKIQALNYAIADMMPHLAARERDQEQAQVLIRAVAFATGLPISVSEAIHSARSLPTAARNPNYENRPNGNSVWITAAISPSRRERRIGELWSQATQFPVGAKALRRGNVVVSAFHVGGQGKRRSDNGESWVLPSETSLQGMCPRQSDTPRKATSWTR